jgi:NADH-quinone oxidoreductase subunit J
VVLTAGGHALAAAAAAAKEAGAPITDLVLFWVFAPIAVAAAIGMVLARNAVHSALFLIVNFFCLAVFFLVLGSPFLFAVQIIVYAGAIMVLFLFVIMLLGIDTRESMVERLRGQRTLAVLLAAGLIAEVFSAIRLGVGLSTKAAPGFDQAVNRGGNVRALARVLFNGYFVPVEATSVLLIIAAVAAMVIAGRRGTAAAAQADDVANSLGRSLPPEPADPAPEPERVP